MPEPLFILAPPRSFTSVVCGMLGQHPEMYGLPEVNLFAGDTLGHLARWYRIRPRFGHGLLRAFAELGLGEQSEDAVESAEVWLEENADTGTADVYRYLAGWAAPRRLVDKSPIYLIDEDALDRIHAAFLDARFLHLTRHPLDTCRSLLGLREYIEKSGGRAGDFGLDPDRAWLQPHARVKQFLDTLPADQWLRVQGELILGDPDFYLPQIAEWLGVSTDAEAVAAMKRPETSPYACEGPANARYGNDPGFMEKPALRSFKPTGSTLDDELPEGLAGEFSDTLHYYANLFGYA